ncbi:DUF2510 domain-containing protein [Microbacterium sp. BK668]|uniref:DUF2510 domain-containing protein n=1 Tax=Microbacterium sp. BK668 TaxID=2512118 RepID=UPI001FB7BC36|nr:DUF2510 domain-containing protein [Microbacterium sp. BK668]
MGTEAEPGWYDDGTGKLRWWDGARWTQDYADFGGFGVEVRSDAIPPSSTPVAAGWYDDGRGRQRWWDGRRWTRQTRFSGGEDAFGGIVVDGRWIHLGDLSQPVGGLTAVVATVADLARRPSLPEAVRARALFTPQGPLTPRQFGRMDRQAVFLAVEGGGQLWLTPVAPQDASEARRFAAWINTSSDHYRYG